MECLSERLPGGETSERQLPVVLLLLHRQGYRRRPLPHHAARRDAHRTPRAATADQRSKQLKLDPAVTRDGDRILLDGEEIARSTAPIHGLAMDLGTTTVVLRLLNLETGEVVADASFENPQRFGGSDVMARIHYDTRRRQPPAATDAGRLSHPCHRGISGGPANDLRNGRGGKFHHARPFFPLECLFHRAKPVSLHHRTGNGRRQTHDDQPERNPPKNCCCRCIPKARVYGLPIISGHVGADAAACMLAVDLANEERLVAVMDIGTNTELILGNKNKIFAASCPAGPAFEGGKISCGMPGLPGAIEKVEIADDGSVQRRRHRRCSGGRHLRFRPRGLAERIAADQSHQSRWAGSSTARTNLSWT